MSQPFESTPEAQRGRESGPPGTPPGDELGSQLSIISLLFVAAPEAYRRISPLRWITQAAPPRYQALAVDLYLIALLGITLAVLFSDMVNRSPFAVAIALFGIVDIIAYQVTTVLVDGPAGRLRITSPVRPVVLSLMNLLELVVCWAILYRNLGNVGGALWQDRPMDALYYSAVTMSTLGYGDFFPQDDVTRLLVIAQLAAAILIVGTILPLVQSSISTLRQGKEPAGRD